MRRLAILIGSACPTVEAHAQLTYPTKVAASEETSKDKPPRRRAIGQYPARHVPGAARLLDAAAAGKVAARHGIHDPICLQEQWRIDCARACDLFHSRRTR